MSFDDMGGRLRQVRMAESVAAELRRRILSAPEGETLPTQADLVAQFGVSHPSVREALRILETEGLIVIRRGNVGGALIRRPDASSAGYALGLALQAARVQLSDLAVALRAYEPRCAAMCAARSDRATAVVPLLRDNIEQVNATEDWIELTRSARHFHDIVVTSCGNATTALVVHSLVTLWSAQQQARVESVVARGMRGSGGTYRKEIMSSHGRITDLIEAGESADVEDLYREHLRTSQEESRRRGFNDQVVDATLTQNGYDVVH